MLRGLCCVLFLDNGEPVSSFLPPSKAELYRARAILRRLRDWRLQQAFTTATIDKNDNASIWHGERAEACSVVLNHLEEENLDLWAQQMKEPTEDQKKYYREFQVAFGRDP